MALLIHGLFICKFPYSICGCSENTKIQYLRSFCFCSLAYLQFFDAIKITLKVIFLVIECSLVIRGFKIRGTLTGCIYSKLQGPTVFVTCIDIRERLNCKATSLRAVSTSVCFTSMYFCENYIGLLKILFSCKFRNCDHY